MTSEGQSGTETAGGDLRRLRRSRDNRLVAGVCGGLAEYFGLGAAIYRIIFVALALAGGSGLLLYAAAALVIPDEEAEDSLAAQTLREHRDRPWLVIGVGLLVLAGFFFVGGSHAFWPVAGGIWLLALIAGALIVAWETGGRKRRPTIAADGTVTKPVDTRPSLFWPGLGALIVGAGVLGLLDATDAVDVNWDVALAGGVIVAGLLVALGFLWRGAAAFGVLGIVLLAFMGAALAFDGISVRGGVGDRTEMPVVASALQHAYRLGVGNLELDLRHVPLPPGETRIEAHVGVGKLVVDLPPGVPAAIDGKVRGGDLTLLDREESGWRVHERVIDPSFANADRRIVLDVDVGLGDVEVSRPPKL
jgi:phage shock protein PspC (stress-responsive transcriptional regulator)